MPRPRIELYLNLSDRETKRKLMSQVGMLQGFYDVDLTPRVERRSSAQNRLYWRNIVTPLQRFLEGQGQQLTKEQCHAIIGLRCLPVSVANPQTGEIIDTVPGSTRVLDVGQFSEFIDRAAVYLSEMFGIEVELSATGQNRRQPTQPPDSGAT